MVQILDTDKIKKADRANPEDVIRELEETRALCEKYERIIRETPDGIYVTDGDANAICVNPGFEEISGLKVTEMLGVNHRDLEKNGVVAKSSALMALRDKKQVTIIHDYLKTGLQALVTSRPVFDQNGEIEMTVSSIRDVTELSSVKAELEAEKEKSIETQAKLEHMQAQILDSGPIIAIDKKMQNLLYTAARIASVDSTVLITGETGTGKEVLAKFIHNNSPRKKNSFIPVNCGAIPENLVESELFGYEAGAFTGARSTGKPGVFELAEGGTVFLDEAGELSMDIQAKLLRALESRKIMRVGGTNQIAVDIRVIAATNRKLKDMVKQGTFRQDLYYRLNVVPLTIPPLRERKEDIIPLANLFLQDVNEKYRMHKKFNNHMYIVFRQKEWPGNVRELKNLVESLVVLSDQDIISLEDGYDAFMPEEALGRMSVDMPLRERMERVEYTYLKDAYETYGNVRDAARSLQMPHATFVRKKKLYEEKYGDPKMDRDPE